MLIMSIELNFWNSEESIPHIEVGCRGQFWVALDNDEDVSVVLLTYLNLPLLTDSEGNFIDGCENWVMFDDDGEEVSMVGWYHHDLSKGYSYFSPVKEEYFAILGWMEALIPSFQ